jgi:hypothetical protein
MGKANKGDRISIDIEGFRKVIEERALLNQHSLSKEIRFLLQVALDVIAQDNNPLALPRIKDALNCHFTQEERAEIAKAAVDAMAMSSQLTSQDSEGLFYRLLSDKDLTELSEKSRIPLDHLQAIADKNVQRYPEDIDLTKLESPLGVSLERLVEIRSATFKENEVEERRKGGSVNGI